MKTIINWKVNGMIELEIEEKTVEKKQETET